MGTEEGSREYEETGANRTVDLLSQNDQLQAENDRLKKLLEAKGSVEVYQQGFDDGKEAAVAACKRIIKDTVEFDKP